MHLPLRPIFRQSHPNFRGGRNANVSKIWAQLTKNLLAKSSTKRFREYIVSQLSTHVHTLARLSASSQLTLYISALWQVLYYSLHHTTS